MQTAPNESAGGPQVAEIDDKVGRRIHALVILIAVYVAFTSAWEAIGRPFWFDEVFTATLTRLPSFAHVTDALRQAVDTPGPGYYFIQRLATSMVADEHLALRLASILALPTTCLCLFWFARDETGPVAAATGAMLPLLSQFYHGYSVEARPYAAMVGLLALACLAWKRSHGSWFWGLTMAAALAAASLVNYYAVFALVPFTLAEIARAWRTRRTAIMAWVAIASGLVPVLIHWSTLSSLRTYYGEYYWSKPSLAKATATYDYVLAAGLTGTGFGMAAILGLALLVACVARVVNPSRPHPRISSLVLIMGFLILPFVAVAVTAVMEGGYSYRYAFGVVIGLSLGLAFALPFAGGRTSLTALVCLLGALLAHDTLFWWSGGRVGPVQRTSVRSHQQLVSRVDPGNLPIVVLNGIDYLPLAYYADPAQRARLVTLLHVDAAREYTGSDSVDRDLLKLRDWWDIRADDFDTFAAEHDRFILIITPRTSNWWLPRLQEGSFVFELLDSEGEATAYLAQRKVL